MTHDPYAAPTVSPDDLEKAIALRDLRWRGALWFAAPLVTLIFLLLFVFERADLTPESLRVPFEMMVSLALPACVAGYASGRRCRSTPWASYLALAVRDAVAWVVYGGLLLWVLHSASPSITRLPFVPGRRAMLALALPLTLLLATTLRRYHRRRP